MRLKNKLLDTEALLDYRSNPLGSGLDDLVDELFSDENTPEEAKLNYSLPVSKNGHGRQNQARLPRLNEQEQREFLKVCTHMGLTMHHLMGHKRDSGKPFWSHPLDTVKAINSYGVSAIAKSPLPCHDVLEELEMNEPLNLRAGDLQTKGDIEDYRAKSYALFLGCGFLAYRMVNRLSERDLFSKNVFRYPENVYPYLNSMLRIVNSMTRRLDESYFLNLYEVFHTNTPKVSALLAEEWESMPGQPGVYKYLDEFFGIRRTNEFLHFLENVYFHRPAQFEADKNQRRTIMGEIADLHANLHDIKGAGVGRKGKLVGKGYIIINDTGRLYGRMKSEEATTSLNRIIKQRNDFIDSVAGKQAEEQGGEQRGDQAGRPAGKHGVEEGIIGGILASEVKPFLPSSVMRRIDEELEEYKKTQYFNRKTTPMTDPYMHAGLTDRIISVLMRWETSLFQPREYRAQYVLFRNMQEQYRAFAENPRRYIEGVWTKLQKDLDPAEKA
ncbi:MAG: hypothetical protein R6U32_02180 [Candidatus Woesearchaeota archaeon]